MTGLFHICPLRRINESAAFPKGWHWQLRWEEYRAGLTLCDSSCVPAQYRNIWELANWVRDRPLV